MAFFGVWTPFVLKSHHHFYTRKRKKKENIVLICICYFKYIKKNLKIFVTWLITDYKKNFLVKLRVLDEESFNTLRRGWENVANYGHAQCSVLPISNQRYQNLILPDILFKYWCVSNHLSYWFLIFLSWLWLHFFFSFWMKTKQTGSWKIDN